MRSENNQNWGRIQEDLFPRNIKDAIELQKKLSLLPRARRPLGPISRIAGADVSFYPGGREVLAGVVVLSFPGLDVLESVYVRDEVRFPYIPGLLSFREAPGIIAAARKLSQKPDVLILDGQGLAHPRRFGLACHVGAYLDWPTIGCAKSRLIGTHREVGVRKKSQCRLMDKNEVVGTVLRSRDGVKCIYVSEGHLVELPEAVKLILRCCRRYRLPEPVRLAHQYVTKLRQTRCPRQKYIFLKNIIKYCKLWYLWEFYG